MPLPNCYFGTRQRMNRLGKGSLVLYHNNGGLSMQILTKDGRLHYVNADYEFTELLYEYLGQDAADAFVEFLGSTVEAAGAAKDRENLIELSHYVTGSLLPAIAKEVKRFRNHPDMDERLEKWAEEFNAKMEDIYGALWFLVE